MFARASEHHAGITRPVPVEKLSPLVPFKVSGAIS